MFFVLRSYLYVLRSCAFQGSVDAARAAGPDGGDVMRRGGDGWRGDPFRERGVGGGEEKMVLALVQVAERFADPFLAGAGEEMALIEIEHGAGFLRGAGELKAGRGERDGGAIGGLGQARMMEIGREKFLHDLRDGFVPVGGEERVTAAILGAAEFLAEPLPFPLGELDGGAAEMVPGLGGAVPAEGSAVGRNRVAVAGKADKRGGIVRRRHGVVAEIVEDEGEIAGEIAQRPGIDAEGAEAEVMKQFRHADADPFRRDGFDPDEPDVVAGNFPRDEPALVAEIKAAGEEVRSRK